MTRILIAAFAALFLSLNSFADAPANFSVAKVIAKDGLKKTSRIW